MKYDEYLAKGYPIGSGVIEGACRSFVKDRMELAGMRWSGIGAEKMLELRSIKVNGKWDIFWQYFVPKRSKDCIPTTIPGMNQLTVEAKVPHNLSTKRIYT